MIPGIVITIALLLGSMATPVAALQVSMVNEYFNYAFAPGENNHTYIYSPSDDSLFFPSSSMMYCNESTDFTTYIYEDSGWSSLSDGYPEDTSVLFEWQPFDTMSSGPFGNPKDLPVFYDFVGSDGSGVVVNTTIERRSFSLNFGQHTPVVMDSDYLYFGTLGISGQEFVHLTVACQQDGFTWTISVIDPEGVRMASTTGSDGDIVVLPFRPSIAGTYIIVLQSNAANGEMALFDFFPEAISPRWIAPGEIISDTLPTGELVVLEGTSSWIQDELVPTVHTYKVNPGDDVSAITYAFNYPEVALFPSQPASITFTSDALVHGINEGYRYASTVPMPATDVYNFRGGVHYITVMGGDNTDYTLYHEADVATELIVNQEFRVDNLLDHTDTRVYSLVLTEPSMIKINTTSTSDFTTTAWATYDDGYRYSRPMTDGSSLPTASVYYMPAGNYIFEVEVGMEISEYMEFTLGPLTTDTSAAIINVGGFIVPTDPGHRYNLTITLGNLYNVSVPTDIGIWDQFYSNKHLSSFILGTWFDGSSQIPHSSHESSLEFTTATRIFSEDYAIITVGTFPYNNTLGVGNDFENYPVEYTIIWEDVTHDDYEDTAFLDISSSSAGHNFTLPSTGTGTEMYSLLLNTTPGTWYNVTIGSNDVDTPFQVISYAPYNERTHYTNWGDLSDTLQGSLPDLSFQFGAISDEIYLEFTIDRNYVDPGYLWVEITPMETHQLDVEQITPAGPDILGFLGAIAVPVAVGAGVIVVVYIVYVKKFKK